MSQMKRYAEEVSVELGFGGEINDQVLAVGQERLMSTASYQHRAEARRCGQGRVVTVYHDPISRKRAEGKALLVQWVWRDDYDGLNRYLVEFADDPGLLVERTVHSDQTA